MNLTPLGRFCQQLVERVLVCGDRSRPTETAVLQIVFDGGLDRNAIGIRFVRQVINSQTQLLRLSGDRSGLCSLLRGLLRVVLNPLVLSSAVAYSNKVGAVLGGFRPAAYSERSIPPACSLDLLPVINSLNCHPVSSLQAHARLYNCYKKCSIL